MMSSVSSWFFLFFCAGACLNCLKWTTPWFGMMVMLPWKTPLPPHPHLSMLPYRCVCSVAQNGMSTGRPEPLGWGCGGRLFLTWASVWSRWRIFFPRRVSGRVLTVLCMHLVLLVHRPFRCLGCRSEQAPAGACIQWKWRVWRRLVGCLWFDDLRLAL